MHVELIKFKKLYTIILNKLLMLRNLKNKFNTLKNKIKCLKSILI
jgi:hypothetical protein